MDEQSDGIRVFEASEQGGTVDYLSTEHGLIAKVPSEQLSAWEEVVARAAAYDALMKSLASGES
jgi:hypothetical protein